MRFTAIVIFACMLVQFGSAQSVTADSLESMLNRAKTFYYNGEYEYAIRELENAMSYLEQLKQTDQVEAYKYLAFSYVAFGNQTKAKAQFKKALQLNPDLELDPATVSPKIIKVFEEAKAEMVTAPPEPPVEPTPVERAEPSNFDATIRSCCVGGWGQMYRGETSKGRKMMIAWGTTLGATLISWIITSNREDEYLSLRYQDEPYQDAYDKYKLWYNISWVSTGIFLGIHAFNLYDVIFRRPSTSTSMLDPEQGFRVDASIDHVRLGYKVKF